jgi:outer membrane receptor protein involved in Fe transport
LSATDPDVAAGRQPTISGDNFPLQGLSRHQFNVTPFIDIGPFSARVSYNWRSRYLLTLRDVITPFDPIFQRAYGQLDASVTFSITDNLKIGLQGVNLLNSETVTEAAVLDANGDVRLVPRGWYTNDRRYTAILRFNF